MDTVLVLFHSSSPVLLKRGSLGLFPEPCLQLVLRCASRQRRHINVYVLIHIRSASCITDLLHKVLYLYIYLLFKIL